MATQIPKRRRTSREVLDKIAIRAFDGIPATQIYAELTADSGIKPEDLPDLRTVQRIIKEDILPHDPSGPWGVGDTDATDAPAVLSVLREVIIQTEARVKHITRAEAEWICAITHATPDLPPRVVHALTQAYLKRQEARMATTDLDCFLAFAPWRGADNERAYDDAYRAGLELPPPWVTNSLGLFGLRRPDDAERVAQLMRDAGRTKEANHGEAE